MSQKAVGWMLAALGVSAVVSAVCGELVTAATWADVLTPGFFARAGLAASGAVSAFIGGKLLPQLGAKR